MNWTPLPRGTFTGIDWARDGAIDGADPYLAWAEATGFESYGRRVDERGPIQHLWLPVALELEEGRGVADLLAVPGAAAWLRIPRVYHGGPFSAGTAVPASVRFCSARVRREFFRQLGPRGRLHGLVRRVELGLPVRDAVNYETMAVLAPGRRLGAGEAPPPVAANRVFGLIDDGLALAHAHFLDAAECSRVAYFWRQDGLGRGVRPKALGYGRELGAAQIDNAMNAVRDASGAVDEDAVYTALGLSRLGKPWPAGRVPYHALDTAISHGTHVMDLAAGPWDVLARLSNPPSDLDAPPNWHRLQDPASQAPIVAVQLDYRTVQDTSGGSMNVHVLDALMYILARCQPSAEVVVNISFGALAGPHDGSSLLEAAMDDLVQRCAGRLQIVLAAGNSYQSRTHANLTLQAGESHSLRWLVPPDDTTPSFLELWLPEGASAVQLQLTPPGHPPLPPFVPGQSGAWLQDKLLRCAMIYPRRSASGANGTCALLALQPTTAFEPAVATAPSGVWEITLTQQGGGAVTIDAYVERDDITIGTRTGARQSRFEDESYDTSGNPWAFVDDPANPSPIRRSGNFSDIATGGRTVSVGGIRARDGSWARYSPRWRRGPASAAFQMSRRTVTNAPRWKAGALPARAAPAPCGCAAPAPPRRRSRGACSIGCQPTPQPRPPHHRLPPRRQRLQQHQPPLAQRHVAADLQVLQQAADHLARAGQVAGDLLVRQTLAQQAVALCVGRLGQAVQQAGEAAVHVDQRHAARVLGGQAGAADQARHQLQREVGVVGDVGQQVVARDDGAHGGLGRLDAGRARAAVERHFAHVFAGAVQAQRQLLAAGVGHEGAQAARAHDVQRVATVAFLDDERAAPVMAFGAPMRQRLDVGRGAVCRWQAVGG